MGFWPVTVLNKAVAHLVFGQTEHLETQDNMLYCRSFQKYYLNCVFDLKEVCGKQLQQVRQSFGVGLKGEGRQGRLVVVANVVDAVVPTSVENASDK